MMVRLRLRRKQESLTFNVDVRARERQDLKHRLHLVPLASSVEEGLSFDQDTQRTYTPKREERRKREERNPKIRVCPMSCPLSPSIW